MMRLTYLREWERCAILQHLLNLLRSNATLVVNRYEKCLGEKLIGMY